MKFRSARASHNGIAARGCAAAVLCALLTVGLPELSANGPASTWARTPASRWVTDELGRKVDVPDKVRRIVSLAPNLTEIVYAMNEASHLVGDTDFCDYPAAAREKPRVGGPINPSLEKIVSLAPDLVLASKSINRSNTVAALQRVGIPVYVTDPRTLDGMIDSVAHIGDVLNAEKAAVPLVQNLRARLAELDRRLAGAAPQSVLFVVWIDPLISTGRRTFLADALRHAGARSVVDTATDWPHISLEEIVERQPEFLVFASAHPAEMRRRIHGLRSQPGWRDLEAVRTGKIIIVSDAINRPAPRMLDAVEQLAHALHPEAFAPGSARSGKTRFAEEACACAR